jgi:hypothetical protein
MSVPSDTERTACIRTRLAEGTLPDRAEDQKIYAGYGEHQPCDCCGHPIGSADVLYEVELPSGCAAPLAMHLKCFATWMAESQANCTCNELDAEYTSVDEQRAQFTSL